MRTWLSVSCLEPWSIALFSVGAVWLGGSCAPDRSVEVGCWACFVSSARASAGISAIAPASNVACKVMDVSPSDRDGRRANLRAAGGGCKCGRAGVGEGVSPVPSAGRQAPVDQVDCQPGALHRGGGQDPVTQVENVAEACAARLLEDAQDSLLQGRGGQEQRGWVEVPLQRHRGSHPPARLVERNAPIDAHHVRAGRGELAEELARLDPEDDDRL